MTIKTDKGIRIKAHGSSTPEWSEFHKRFYLWGYRWIKSRQAWSATHTLHNFKSFEGE